MKIKEYYENKELLKEQYEFFIQKKQLIKTQNSKNLILAHIKKAEHNLKFSNSIDNEFIDWKIVGLYYALYHSALALVVNKNYISNNHTATLIFLIKNYCEVTEKEIEFLENFKISKEDLEFYTTLKEDRHSASYSTNIIFTEKQFKEYQKETINFLNKTKLILDSSN